jgi:hypothetical protein
VVGAMCASRQAAAFNNSRKEAKMRRVSQLLVLLLVVGIVSLGGVAPVVAGQKGAGGGGAPKPDGKFQLMTTSIAPMGASWADGRFSFNNQEYKFQVEAQTMADQSVLQQLAGQQIMVEGAVYNLKNVSDFAGTYTRVTPEAVKAMGGTGRDPVFHNDKGVVLRVTRREKQDPSLHVRLLGDSFKVTMRSL